MSGNVQSPCETSAWEAAFQLALAATHAPCTVVVDVVFVRVSRLPLAGPIAVNLGPPWLTVPARTL